MLFMKNKANPYVTFLNLVEENIGLFGDTIASHMEGKKGEKFSDEEFVACYMEGMEKLINKLHHIAYADLSQEGGKELARYVSAMEAPARHGFRFKNEEMTIGKIYLYYTYGKTGRKAPKSDCIKLERYAFSLIGKQCLDYGLVS